jgi:hypothetical protein
LFHVAVCAIGNGAQALEQLQAAMRDFSPIVGTYYVQLVAAGIPVDLAESLVLQWRELFWCKNLGLPIEE